MRVIFLLLQRTEVMDLAGPLQVFYEANRLGADYRLVTCGAEPEVASEQGPWLARLAPLPEPAADDLVLVPGGPVAATGAMPPAVAAWLRRAARAGAHMGSICTGTFVLGAVGLLDGRACTTHWSRLDELARRFPRARVLRERLFVTDGRLTTSAGVASGIDMALALVEARHGPRLASLAARELVVYLRRDGASRQESVYLDFRGHMDQGVHRVQDWLAAHAEDALTLPRLAGLAHLSVRSLTRKFRHATGLSVHEFATRVRLNRARDLLRDPGLTLEAIAARCGFADARQLRRLWQAAHGEPLSAARARWRAGDAAPPPARAGKA